MNSVASPRARERVNRVERRFRGVDVHRERLGSALEVLKRVRERRRSAEQLGTRGVSEVLALPRDTELKQHRRDRRDDDRRERAEQPERESSSSEPPNSMEN